MLYLCSQPNTKEEIVRYSTILFNKGILFIHINDNIRKCCYNYIGTACNILFLLVFKYLWKVEIERRVKQADNSSALPTSPDT